MSAGHLTSEERLVLTDAVVSAVYGAPAPELAALGYHRRPDLPGWFIWSARYERSGMTGGGPPTLRPGPPRRHP